MNNIKIELISKIENKIMELSLKYSKAKSNNYKEMLSKRIDVHIFLMSIITEKL